MDMHKGDHTVLRYIPVFHEETRDRDSVDGFGVLSLYQSQEISSE